ncbi:MULTISPECIES: hypothetical protein [Chryseobacterium]|uniref:Tetratricopeptide repeat protein n=1 Tax=Chryseobacterium geocarposphaerae TaxID=1416776 RepID=A0ABU1LI05_9FLAO|nr:MULTISPECIES: hypothetical protein [Chryseobacterium]MDR6406366.1 hypothetical protein [Chryseobacterium geocarposphaerae]MDR6699195.1 hypothetical protein [Chryseobacterium ginsenosidimutans]
MNHRVLELLKAPKNIQSEDLNLLKEEINSFPYVQNIRALYLYGVHLHDQENYQKVLSTTAAYTTDKKILYQLINGKIQQKPRVETQPETVKEKVIPAENPLKLLQKARLSSFPIRREETPKAEVKPEIIEEPKVEAVEAKEEICILSAPREETKHIYVNGERNRILFEGEENFLNDENVETIDLESTLESGSIVTQKIEKKPEIVEEIQEFTPETIIEEEKINSEPEKQEILSDSQLSFHETEPFLPEVKDQNNKIEEEIKEKETVIETESLEVDKTERITEFTPERIINEDKISSEKEKKSVRDDEELSFHGMESFLPDVKIQAGSEEKKPEVSQSSFNKHEEEMRRLIEEVEKKMKEKAASQERKKEEEPENTGHDISFAETQSFEVKPIEPEIKEEAKQEIKEKKPTVAQLEKTEETQKAAIEEEKMQPAAETEIKSAWKPMSFESNLPDSLINKPAEIPQPKIETETKKAEVSQPEIKQEEITKQEKILPEIEAIPELQKDKSEKFEENTEELQIDKEAPKTEETKDDVPVMNVSFFSKEWTIAEPKKEEKQEETQEVEESEISEEKVIKPILADSNIPGFINTWQNWLKIDRTEEGEKDKDLKTKVIENFIENNPKISQLKDEVNFVVKEKNDDISHLMTETLANLYVEQKLYTKAIKAFETLIRKTPEKKEYYEGKIQEIRDFRSKG